MVHCKPKPCKAYRELPISQFSQGKTCFQHRDILVNLCTSLLEIAVCFRKLMLSEATKMYFFNILEQMKTLDSPKNQTNKLFVFSVKSKKEKKNVFWENILLANLLLSDLQWALESLCDSSLQNQRKLSIGYFIVLVN